MKLGIGRIIAFLGSLIGLGRRAVSWGWVSPPHRVVGWEPRKRRNSHRTMACCKLNRVAKRRAKREMEKRSRRINRGRTSSRKRQGLKLRRWHAAFGWAAA